MKKNPQNIEENNETKKGFLKKVWYSIDKIEKYAELSAEGFARTIKYLSILVLMIAIISSLVSTYRTSVEIKNVAQYINEKVPELTYNEGTLKVNSEETIVDESSDFGKVIIDTNTDNEEQINQYINEVNQDGNGIIILKDKLLIKREGVEGTIKYEYKELLSEVEVTEFTKQELVSYLTSSNMMPLYLNLIFALFVYAFAIYFINTLWYIATIALVGYVVTLILRLKIRFVAVFNMAVYAITLPTLLNMLYIIINAFYSYTINYFDIMYMLVAVIYMMAAIFILKSEFNKKQGEVQKIVEVEKQVKEETEEQKQEEKNDEENKENKETTKKNKKKQQKEDDTNGEEPEGSNA